MSTASKSKSNDKKAGKEHQKTSSKPSGSDNATIGIPENEGNPLLGKVHTVETGTSSSSLPLQISSRFQTIDDMDDPSGNSTGTGIDDDTVSNNDSWSGDSEDHKEKTSHQPSRQEATLSEAEREKIRQKNEKKHQRQKERRAQELHERCRVLLMSRKLEALTQQLIVMGFSSEQATRALILKKGNIEDSVTWLFEEGEAVADSKEHNNLDGCNLKLDISEELARIADMEIRYTCSKQDAERAIVACEGDLEKAAETLRMRQHNQPCASPKPEETVNLPVVSNSKLSVSAIQNSSRAQPKQNDPSTTVQQRRDERDFNYNKAFATGVAAESQGSGLQGLRKVDPKSEWVRRHPIAVSADRRQPTARSSASVSYSLASPPLATSLPTKMETRYVSGGSEVRNLPMGSGKGKEPVVVMQRPRYGDTNKVEAVKPSIGLSPLVPGTRSLPSNNMSSNQLFNQLKYQHPQSVSTSSGQLKYQHPQSVSTSSGQSVSTSSGQLKYQHPQSVSTSSGQSVSTSSGQLKYQHPQSVSTSSGQLKYQHPQSVSTSSGQLKYQHPQSVSTSSGPTDPRGAKYQHPHFVPTSSGPTDPRGASSQGNGLWNTPMMGSSPPAVAAASSLGFFPGFGSSGSSRPSSSIEWNASGTVGRFDYAAIDWTLKQGSLRPRSSGAWRGMTTSVMQNNSHMYNTYASGPSTRFSMRPADSAMGGFVGLQGVGRAPPERSAGGGSSHEWSSPFEERDLFSLPRQVVSSPYL